MNNIREIEVGGKTLKVREESFSINNEDWNSYDLKGGTSVHAKLTAIKIFRVLDDEGNPKFSPLGEPQVIVRHQVQIAASEPQSDKKEVP